MVNEVVVCAINDHCIMWLTLLLGSICKICHMGCEGNRDKKKNRQSNNAEAVGGTVGERVTGESRVSETERAITLKWVKVSSA